MAQQYKYLLGLPIECAEGVEMAGYYPVVDYSREIIDIIDGDHYSPIFGKVRKNLKFSEKLDCYRQL